ncbi:MAG: dihydrofolate reductase [Candidatus Gracilibacteria bacterium]|nr:dihydrofolate reductase [Candidatus Gracilibacteria bacterium]
MKFNIILAVDEKNGILKRNTVSWNLPSDMKYFKKITSETSDLAKMNAVIMGRVTWFSISSKFRPLPDRINCILSRELKQNDIGSEVDDFVLYFNSLEHCLSELESKQNIENIFIIGGADLYNQVLTNPMLDKIYMTKIKGDVDCDVSLNKIPHNFIVESYTDWEIENNIEYSFWVYKRVD